MVKQAGCTAPPVEMFSPVTGVSAVAPAQVALGAMAVASAVMVKVVPAPLSSFTASSTVRVAEALVFCSTNVSTGVAEALNVPPQVVAVQLSSITTDGLNPAPLTVT